MITIFRGTIAHPDGPEYHPDLGRVGTFWSGDPNVAAAYAADDWAGQEGQETVVLTQTVDPTAMLTLSQDPQALEYVQERIDVWDDADSSVQTPDLVARLSDTLADWLAAEENGARWIDWIAVDVEINPDDESDLTPIEPEFVRIYAG